MEYPTHPRRPNKKKFTNVYTLLGIHKCTQAGYAPPDLIQQSCEAQLI